MYAHQELKLEKEQESKNTFIPKIKLHEIREHVNDYKKHSFLGGLFFGYYPEEREINAFLSDLADKPKDYLLNEDDLFKLFNIIKKPSWHFTFIHSICSMFYNSYHIFEIIQALDKTTSPKRDNYLKIYALQAHPLGDLYQLCCTQLSNVPLTQNILDAFVDLDQSGIMYLSDFGNSLNLLSKNNILNKTTIQIVTQHRKKDDHFASLLKTLVQLHYLNEETFSILAAHFSQNNSGVYLFDLLPCLSTAKILDKKLLERVCKADLNNEISEIAQLLNRSGSLNETTFSILLEHDFKSLYDAHPLCKNLQSADLLNESNLNVALKMRNNYPFQSMLKILSKNHLLNQPLLDILIKPDSDMYHLNNLLDYLQSANLLRKDNVESLLSDCKHLYHSYPLAQFFKILKEENFKMDQENLSILMKNSDIEVKVYYLNKISVPLIKCHLLNNALFNKLLLLPKVNLARISDVVDRLYRYNLLNQASFDHALDFIFTKLPSVSEVKVTKIKRKEPEQPLSIYTLDGVGSFYIEHDPQKKYLSGGMGVIKKAYASPKDQEPQFALKRLRHKEKDEAIREVKYQRLQDRKAFFFSQNNKNYIFYQWLTGKALEHYKPEEIKQVPVVKRLQWVIMALSQINVMHKINSVHGDIKPLNFILDILKGEMHLTDYGTSRKVGSEKHFGWTDAYRSKTSYSYDFSEDVYSMGKTIAVIFPELYSLEYVGKRAVITVTKKDPLSSFDNAIVNLISAMTCEDNNYLRCSIEDALQYCQQLVLHHDHLTEETLKKIMDSTINHTPLTVNDVEHGRLRR